MKKRCYRYVTILKSNNDKPPTDNAISFRKNFEKIIKNKLITVKEHIPNHQFGFKNQCLPIHPLIIFTFNIQTSYLEGKLSAAVFMDISKAFDSV